MSIGTERMLFVFLVLPLAARQAFAGFCDPPSGSPWRMVWHDEFDGEVLDESKWKVEVGVAPSESPRCRGESCARLGSCRMAACTREDVYLKDGKLVLRSQRRAANGRNFTTGAVNTWDTAAWRASEGTFRLCISAQLPGSAAGQGQAQGLWPAHWMMPRDETCDPDEGEMDIMEMVNGDGKWEGTYHWQTNFPAQNCSYPTGHEHQYAGFMLDDWNRTFHEFAVERGPSHVAFVVDGVVRLNATVGSQPPPVFWDAPWYLIMNTAVGGGWPGPPNSSTVFPAHHIIDYVRVSQLVSAAVV